MSVLQAEVYEAFRTLAVPDDKALKAAVAKVEDETEKAFNKRDADIEAIRKDITSINKEVAGINTRLAAFQGEVNGRLTSFEGAFDKRLTAVQGDQEKRIASMQGDMNTRMAFTQGEIDILKWMMGTVIALLVTVLFRVFTH